MRNGCRKDWKRVRQVFTDLECHIKKYVFGISVSIYYQLALFFTCCYSHVSVSSGSLLFLLSVYPNLFLGNSHIGHPAEIFCYCHYQKIPVSPLFIWKWQRKRKTILSNTYYISLPDSIV